MGRCRVAIIIPACNEAVCISLTLRELKNALKDNPYEFIYAVGLNGTTDNTGEVAMLEGALIREADSKGYGYGCLAAIQAVTEQGAEPDLYVFCAADGASAPEDILKMLKIYEEEKCDLLLGQRTFSLRNLAELGPFRWFANIVFGVLSGAYVHKVWSDIGPLRLCKAAFFHELDLREFTWGWTAEMQMLAVRHGGKVRTCKVQERPRNAGEQKISGVSLKHSLSIGKKIIEAILRVAKRPLPAGVAL